MAYNNFNQLPSHPAYDYETFEKFYQQTPITGQPTPCFSNKPQDFDTRSRINVFENSKFDNSGSQLALDPNDTTLIDLGRRANSTALPLNNIPPTKPRDSVVINIPSSNASYIPDLRLPKQTINASHVIAGWPSGDVGGPSPPQYQAECPPLFSSAPIPPARDNFPRPPFSSAQQRPRQPWRPPNQDGLQSNYQQPNEHETIAMMREMIHHNMTLTQQLLQSNLNQKEFHVMPDFSKTISNFNGEKGSQEAKIWLEQVEAAALANNWPDSFLLQTVKCHLEGGARAWFLGRIHEFSTWSQMRDAFRKTFIRDVNKSDAWDKMKKHKQGVDENITSYYYEKIRLCRPLNLSFEEIKEEVAIGLRSRDMVLRITAAKHADEDDLFADLMKTERTLKLLQCEQTRNPKHDINKINTANVMAKKTTTETRDLTEIKCFNCQEQGHFARDCPKPKRELTCGKCKQQGHGTKSCTRPTPISNGEVQMLYTNNHESLHKYIKKVKINNRIINAMIDTGSSDCTLKASVVLAEDFKIQRVTSELRAFGSGHYVKSIGVVCADIKVDDVEGKNVVMRVVADDAQPYDAIIGRTYTELPHIAYVKIGDQLIFRNSAELELSSIVPNDSQPTIGISSVNENYLEAASINFIELQIDEHIYPLGVINQESKRKTLYPGAKIGPKIYSIEKVPEMSVRQEPVAEEEINIDPEIAPDQQKKLVNILNANRECIAKNINELGCTSSLEMDIITKPGAVPFTSKPYRATREERETIKQIVKEWKDVGIVTETSSPYASPVLLVKKKNGEARLVVDYRKLNSQTERISYPLPHLDEYLESVHDAKIFAVLDLAHGYLQVPLKEEARAKTAFITPDDTGEFTRAVFGLMNAPFYFSKVMENALAKLRNEVNLRNQSSNFRRRI